MKAQARLPQRSSSQKWDRNTKPPVVKKRSASPQPRIVTSTPSVVEAEKKPPLEKARSHSPINPMEKSDEDKEKKSQTPPAAPGGLMRFLMPLKNSLSVSADNLPKPLSVTLTKNLGRRPSKCQSFD